MIQVDGLNKSVLRLVGLRCMFMKLYNRLVQNYNIRK